MASDSWNNLLFTSHSRTNDQLQDKLLNIIMLFLTVAPKSRSKESNVQMPTWAWDWLFRSKSTFLEQWHHTKVIKSRKHRLHSIFSFIQNFWSHFHTKRFLFQMWRGKHLQTGPRPRRVQQSSRTGYLRCWCWCWFKGGLKRSAMFTFDTSVLRITPENCYRPRKRTVFNSPLSELIHRTLSTQGLII